MTILFGFAVATTIALSIGVSWGVAIAEKSAVCHADRSTAHNMQGRFYYIIPESDYVDLIVLRHVKPINTEGDRTP